jgi:hypothetical protein
MALNVNTLGDVISETYDEASIDGDTIGVAGMERTAMEKWANRFSKWFLQKTKLKSQYATHPFRTLADTTLSVEAAAGSLTLTTSVSNATLGWPTAGYVLVNGTPMAYSGFSTTSMTVAATPALFEAGATMQLGYALPSLFARPVSMFIGSTPYWIQKWGKSQFPPSQHYFVYSDYFFLPRGQTGAMNGILHYFKQATNVLATGTNMDIYQMWDAYVIFKGTARIYRLLNDDVNRDDYEGQAAEVLKMAKGHISDQSEEDDLAIYPDF